MLKSGSKYDSALFLIVLILLVIGVVMVYSASSFKAQETFGDSRYFLKNHFYKVLIGLALMLIVSRMDYRIWLKISPVLLVISFGLLIYLLASSDIQHIRGSKRWVRIAGLQFQPSDFAKLALVLWLSFSLGKSNWMQKDTSHKFVLRLAIIALIIVPILLQPDVGTAVLIAFIAIAIFFVSGEKLQNLFMSGVVATTFLAMALRQQGYPIDRILKFMGSLRGEELHYQSQQSLIAFGNGGFFGLGLGDGRQKFHFLPDPFTDFIYAIVGEELGIPGSTAILALLVLFIWIGFRIALTTTDKSGRLLAFGIILNIAIYAFTNAAVVLNLLPTTGIPMPFLSYGGSSLLVNLFSVGILLNISQKSHKKGKLYPVGVHPTQRASRRA